MTLTIRNCLFLFALLIEGVLVLGLSAQAQVSQPPTEASVLVTRMPSVVDERSSLRSAMGTEGSIRVIAYLDVPIAEEGPKLGTRALVDQRSRIQGAQDALIRSLPDSKSRIHRQFKTIPAMALTVDAQGLNALATSPEVTAIVRDIALPPILDGTVPIIEGDQLHDLGWTGRGQAVAILDTGIDRDHPMFLDEDGDSRVVSEACFSSNSGSSSSLCPNGSNAQTGIGAAADCSNSLAGCGHGTHVAGIAAGSEVTSGGSTFAGVAPEADIVAIQVFSEFTPSACGSTSPCIMSWSSDQIAALEWLLDQDQSKGGPLQVASANMSLGGGRYTNFCDSASVGPAIRNLKNIGVATVIASGNSGYSDSISGPACVSDAIAVGATTNSDFVAFYTSASATLIDLYAPGSRIVSAANGGGYVSYSGTSMATPHVAGAWALMRHAGIGGDATTSVEEIETVLKQTGAMISDRESSSGAIDLGYAHPRIALKTALERYDSADDWLTVRLAGQGSGAVISSPAGIDCGANCAMVVEVGDVIVLQATPDADSEFVRFDGCSSVSNQQCTIEVTGNQTVTVTFDLAPPDNDDFANARVLEGVSIAQSFSTIGASFETEEPLPVCDFSADSSVWFAWSLPDDALPSNVRVDTIGSEFDTVLDVFTGTELSALTSLDCDFGSFEGNWADSTVTFEAFRDVTYYFRVSGFYGTEGMANLNFSLDPLTYPLEVAVDGAGSGAVSGGDIDCGSSSTQCSATYTIEDEVSLTAVPASGSEFEGWTGDCATFASDGLCEFSIRGPRSTTAFFKTILPNDNLDAATAISFDASTPFEDQIDLSLASRQTEEVAPTCGSMNASVWYVWNTPSDVSAMPVAIDLGQSDANRNYGIAVYASSSSPVTFSELIEVGCQTNQGQDLPLLRLVDEDGVSLVESNATYYIQIGQVGSTSGVARMRAGFGDQLLFIEQTVTDSEDGDTNEPGGIEVLSRDAFCFTKNCTEEFANGQSVTLQAYSPTANGTNPTGLETHGFVDWVGCDSSAGRTCSVTMNADKTVTARYEKTDARALQVEISGRATGQVQSSDAAIECNNTLDASDDRVQWQGCAAGYRNGERIELVAESQIATIVQWSENCTVNPADAWRCEVEMDQDQVVTATLIDAYVLTTSSLGLGEIVASEGNLGRKANCQEDCFYYPMNQVLELEAIADPRYRFQQWTGACRGQESTCSITLDGDRSVGAIFEIVPTIFNDQFEQTDD